VAVGIALLAGLLHMGEHVNIGVGIVVEDPLAGGRVVLPCFGDEIGIGE
jgi:hypothetical protein